VIPDSQYLEFGKISYNILISNGFQGCQLLRFIVISGHRYREDRVIAGPA
jgi:hypothetical protein